MASKPARAEGCNGTEGKILSTQQEPVTLIGGYWLPSLAVAAYTWQLSQWYRQMEDEQRAGQRPFHDLPWLPAMAATVVYLTGLWLGTKAMRKRPPFECKRYMLVYNVYQVLLNLWFVVEFAREVFGFGVARGMTFWGNRFDQSLTGFKLSFIIWAHYNNKFIELLDTVWMVLRQKSKQVSFLHIYHHVLMMWAWLYACKVECGGDAWFGACINSLVHVIMYSYYALSQLGVRCPWKKYLTMVQMGQFCVCMIHSAFVLYVGNAPAGLPLAQAFVMVNMLVLFSNFYSKTYGAKKGSADKSAKLL